MYRCFSKDEESHNLKIKMRFYNLARDRELLDNCIRFNLGHQFAYFIEVNILNDIKG